MNELKIKDFKESDYFSFESNAKLWDEKKSMLIIDFGEESDSKEMLIKHIDKINELLKWIKENKTTICNFLVSNKCIPLAEEWASSAEEVSKDCYILPDGEKVTIPIIEKDFLNAMYIDSVLIDFEEDETRPDTTIDILFTPDYFDNHSLIIYIDGDKNIEYGDMAG